MSHSLRSSLAASSYSKIPRRGFESPGPINMWTNLGNDTRVTVRVQCDSSLASLRPIPLNTHTRARRVTAQSDGVALPFPSAFGRERPIVISPSVYQRVAMPAHTFTPNNARRSQ